jgi:hypothetical protein
LIKRAVEKIPGIIFDIIELGDAGDRRRLRALLDMDDFSKPRLPLHFKIDNFGVSSQSPGEALQVTWHSDPKLLDLDKKKHRRGSTEQKASMLSVKKKKRKRDEDTLPLFDEE